MKRIFILSILAALIFSLENWFSPPMVRAQPQRPEEGWLRNQKWVEVRLDPNFRPARILPPESHLNQQSTTAVFTINYLPPGTYGGDQCTTWPDSAKAAFSYAANIWGSLLSSPVPIVIDACWATNLPSGVLGHSGAIDYWANFTNAPKSDVWYPNALANALYGSDLAPSQSDIYIAYNRTFAWYFGTDGNTPGSQVDFVSVVLHEIAHGLGFSGSMWYGWDCGGANYGCWGDIHWGYPDAYDTFMENGGGNSLLNTTSFPNPSRDLGTQLTSNNLYFNGTNAKNAYNGNRPKMYAPNNWMPGSSYSHLDYDTFINTDHRLMVYAISFGASIHYPGSITLGILQDIGWSRPAIPSASKIYLPIALKSQPVPDPGYWQTTYGSRYFYVSTDRASVKLYTIRITLSGGPCSGQVWEIWKPDPLPISNNQFSFYGAFNGNGTFLSSRTAIVTDRITNLNISGCGTFNGGPWTNSFAWQNSSQPTVDPLSDLGESAQVILDNPPSVEVFYTP